jgi:hypothetical protein
MVRRLREHDWCLREPNHFLQRQRISSSSATPSSSSNDSGGSGISTAVGGVIGAMVTLAVVLGVEALILLVAGMRVVRKKSLAASPVGSETGAAVKA